MSLIETGGVIIKAQEYKENDKLLWIFTEKLGKITVIAKGAKKNKSKLFSPFFSQESRLISQRNGQKVFLFRALSLFGLFTFKSVCVIV